MSSSYCVIHYNQIKAETLLPLTDVKIKQINKCAQQWLAMFKEPEKSLASSVTSRELSNSDCYHQQCYLRFASDSKVERALKSFSKGLMASQVHDHINKVSSSSSSYY